jgi:hypothetical protein
MENCQTFLEEYFQRPIDHITLLTSSSSSLSPTPSTSSVITSKLSRYLIIFTDQSQQIIISHYSCISSIPTISSSLSDNEIYFYQKLSHGSSAKVLPYLISIPSQESSSSSVQQTLQRNLLIFNDLPLLDPQISFSPAASQLNLLHLKAAVIELGKFHSSYYFHETPPPSEIPSASALYGNYNYQAAYPKFVETWDDLLEEYVEENEKKILLEVFEHCSQHVSNWTILLEMGPPSLVHGSYRPDNLIIQKGTEESAPSDFSVTLFNFQSIFIGKLLIFSIVPPFDQNQYL